MINSSGKMVIRVPQSTCKTTQQFANISAALRAETLCRKWPLYTPRQRY